MKKKKMKSRSHRYDMKRLRNRHGHKHIKYEMCQSRVGWWLYVSSNTSATFEAQFIQTLSDTEADLKNSVWLV